MSQNAAGHEEPNSGPDELNERLLTATVGALELFSIHLGCRLGLYRTLEAIGPATEGQLAESAAIAPRYAREWLEQQAVAGFITVEGPGADQTERRYSLPVAHRGALLDPIDGDHLAPLAAMVVGVAAALDEVEAAYRSGGGVAYQDYGAHFRHGQGGINRPAFSDDLITRWIPAVDGVVERLETGARVLDLACGQGWSTIAIHNAWPSAEVIGIDLDRASIADARHHAENLGVDAHFMAVDGSECAALGPFDVVLILESLHDMSDPVGVLGQVRAALADDGVVVIAEEAVSERFTAPGDELERMMYGWSVSHCLPVALAAERSEAIGTVIRPDTIVDLAKRAGFDSCETVDVDGGFLRIYRLA